MSTITISIEQAFARSYAALKNSGTAEGNARTTAEALVRAETDGQRGHGLSRVPSYAAQARSGRCMVMRVRYCSWKGITPNLG